jgi:hypothetical protein
LRPISRIKIFWINACPNTKEKPRVYVLSIFCLKCPSSCLRQHLRRLLEMRVLTQKRRRRGRVPKMRTYSHNFNTKFTSLQQLSCSSDTTAVELNENMHRLAFELDSLFTIVCPLLRLCTCTLRIWTNCQ